MSAGPQGIRGEYLVAEPGPVLTGRIIGLAIKVHRRLGPGLLESAYEKCLSRELQHAGLTHARQVDLPLVYEDVQIESSYRADIVVEDKVLLELKSVEQLLPVHLAQTLTYLRLSGCGVGLLMNFGSVRLTDGIRRFIR